MPFQVQVDVCHALPGRLRVRLPYLRADESFGLRLQGLLEAAPGVASVRLNPTAGCVIIQYDATYLQSPGALSLIRECAEKALRPDITPQIILRFDVFTAQGLSAYEFQQVQAIKNAWLSKPGGVFAWLARVLNIFTNIGDRLLPKAMFAKIFELHDRLVGQWQENWQDLRGDLGPAQCQDMLQAPLASCDRLAGRVRRNLWRWGSSEGALFGILGPLGLIGSIPLAIVQALKTIHSIGLCYGYPPDTETERLFSFAIVAAATAHTPEEYQSALANLRQLHRDISESATEDLLTEMELAEVTGETKEAIIALAMTSFSDSLAVFTLPLVGAILGAWGMWTFLDHIAEVAQHAYQVRWLLRQGRLSMAKEEAIDLNRLTATAAGSC